jgi:ATP-dependent Clp endopeptidase proteolytic subunit ClpP
MIYTVDPNASEPIMLLNKHIGNDEQEGLGIVGSVFQEEILLLDTMGKKRIQVWINSPGGAVIDGYSIFSAILKANTPVDTYCVGCAASIAGVIFQAGRKRVMADYSWLMYHNPFAVGGNENKTQLDTIKKSIVTMIAQKSGMDDNDVVKLMDRTSYITADEAYKMGLCDMVEDSFELNTKYLKKINDSLLFHKEANKFVNSLLHKNTKTQNMVTIDKIAMRLRLNGAALESDVIEAIDAIENKAKKAEEDMKKIKSEGEMKMKELAEELDKLKSDLEKKKVEYEKCKTSLEDYKSKYEAMEEDKKKAEMEDKKNRAKVMVENYAKLGRIKNEQSVILKWTNLAVQDMEGTKAMIEDLPFNKPAVVINPNATQLKDGEMPTSALSLMVQNRMKRQGK